MLQKRFLFLIPLTGLKVGGSGRFQKGIADDRFHHLRLYSHWRVGEAEGGGALAATWLLEWKVTQMQSGLCMKLVALLPLGFHTCLCQPQEQAL